MTVTCVWHIFHPTAVRVLSCVTVATDAADASEEHCTEQSLKDGSPFTAFFNCAVQDVVLPVDDTVPPNEDCWPEGLDAIRNYLHIYPLWSAALHNNIQRFASDAVDSSEILPSRPRSNAKVESYFGQVKTHAVSSLRQRPSAFLREMLTFVKGKLNESQLPPVARRTKQSELSCIEETWRPRRSTKKPRKYVQSSSAMQLLTWQKNTIDSSV